MVAVDGDRKPVAVVLTPANESHAQVSSDGKWMAYQSDETGRTQIYVRPFPEGSGNKSQISLEGAPAQFPRWRGDGKELFFVVAPNMMSAEIRVTGSSIQPAVPRMLFPLLGNPVLNIHASAYHPYAVTPAGTRFLIPQPSGAVAASAAGGLAGAIINAVDQGNGGGTPASSPDSVNI